MSVSKFVRSAAVALLLAVALPMQAQAPATTTQVPGYYRLPLGRLTVTALFDGTVDLPLTDLRGMTPSRARALLRDQYVPEGPHGLHTSVNAFLVQEGGHLTLVDTGAQSCFGPGLAQVLPNLKAAGYAPEQVNDILITHAHPDHLCGILDANDQPAYPNATVWLAREDGDYWLDPKRDSDPAVPAMFRPLFAMARKAVAPYQAAGKLRLFKTTDALPGGATLIASHGHTPGHSAYLFDGGANQKLLVWGDSLHFRAIQFSHPEIAYAGDADIKRAVAARQNLLKQAVANGWWVGAAHVSFPGLGHIRHDGKRYAWVPAEFLPIPPTQP
ncbi:MBL fold metallo-hydrolase [Solilutibacter silvestris]|uniref:MBL fold metallo-hydrolase n=1 Tax=Solilutibacter silvestris TaxID=1645665 RepID=UPI003D328E5F